MTQARPGPIPVIARTNARATAACAGNAVRAFAKAGVYPSAPGTSVDE
jgi:hypothetical protein